MMSGQQKIKHFAFILYIDKLKNNDINHMTKVAPNLTKLHIVHWISDIRYP